MLVDRRRAFKKLGHGESSAKTVPIINENENIPKNMEKMKLVLDNLLKSKFKISIIIPAYNEEKRVTKCIERILEYFNETEWDLELIVAEDGSTDNTVKIVKGFASHDNRVKLHSFPDRLGKGGAIKNAMLHATKDHVCFMDADLSADVTELKRLMPYVNDYEIIIGSRKLRGNLSPIKSPLKRKIFSSLYAKYFRLLFRINVHDPQCGFKLFNKNIVPTLFNEIHTTGFAFDSEVLVKASRLGYKIKEVPINWKYDPATKVSVFKQMIEMNNALWKIWYELHLSRKK